MAYFQVDTLKFERDTGVQADTLPASAISTGPDSGVMVSMDNTDGRERNIMERFVEEFAVKHKAKTTEIMAKSAEENDKDKLQHDLAKYLSQFHENADLLQKALSGDVNERISLQDLVSQLHILPLYNRRFELF